MQPDGDLWQSFTQLVLDKGAYAVDISWYKAHASIVDMLQGRAGIESSMHNSIADFLADQAYEAQDLGGLRDLLCYHATKRKSFHQLLVDINMLIIRVLAEEETLREAKCTPNPLQNILAHGKFQAATPAHYKCPTPDEGFAIDLVPFNEEGLSSEDSILADQLWLFWKHSKFQVADSGEQGCSWLELFARFQYLGGRLLPVDSTTTIACSFKKLLALFQSRSRSLFHAARVRCCLGAREASAHFQSEACSFWCPSVCTMSQAHTLS